MAITETPTRDYLRALAQRLDAAGHGEKGALLAEVRALYGWSRDKLYAELKRQAGWESGRKARADKGSTRVATESLQFLAAMQRGSVRANGKQTMFMPVAASIAAQNGHDIAVSTAQLNRLLRARRLAVKQQAAAHAPTSLRSLHPNHVHQVDPSLCLVYYLRGKQFMIRDDQFYKNKLDRLAKVQFKCWRYVLTDHASGTITVRYFESAGESAKNLFLFLMYAWGQQPGRRFHGAPQKLVWDKGSANTAGPISALLGALEIEGITHAAGNARAKGSVENANNLVETQFECRLKLDPVHSIDELNAAAQRWSEAYNANLIPGQDTRLRRAGMAPTARHDLWLKITPEQLRILPPVEACQELLEGRIETRKVSRSLTLSYRHPKATAPCTYDVAGIAGVCAGDRLEIRPLLFGNAAISITVTNYQGEDSRHRLEPLDGAVDDFGFAPSAAVIGEEYKRRPDSDADRSAKTLDALMYPDMDAAQMAAAIASNAAPFGGAVDAHRHLASVDIPSSLPRRGSEIAIQAARFEAQPLSISDGAKRLRAMGVETPDLYAWLSQRYPQGIAEADIESIAARLSGTEAARIRAVAG